MTILVKVFFPISLVILTSGCSFNLNDIRDRENSGYDLIKKASFNRSRTIKTSDTLYSNSLRCLSKKFFKSEKKLDISVSKILDKTGKVYPMSSNGESSSSTALSDIVMNALAKMPESFNVVDTPLGSPSESRVNLVDPKNPGNMLLSNVDIGLTNSLPIGVIYPTASYISGSLVQYDEGTESPSENSGLSIGVDPVSTKRTSNTITIGLNLKLVNSGTGRLADNGSIILTNRLRTIRKSSNLFKIIHEDAHILDYDTVVSDPKHHSVMEIVEKGVYELLKNQIKNDSCSPDSLTNQKEV